MAKRDRNTLKSFFETGKRPTEGNYSDLIDSQFLLSGENTGSVGLQGDMNLDGYVKVSGIISSSSHIETTGHVTASGTVKAGNLNITGNATVDGAVIVGSYISSSSDIFVNDVFASGLISRAGDANTGLQLASDTVIIQGNDIHIAGFNTTRIELNKQVTASGVIKAASFVGDGSGLTNITSTNTIQNVTLVTASLATGSLFITGSVNYTSGSTNVLLGIESSGSILPNKDGEVDLGAPTKYWKDLYVSGSHAQK